MKYERINSLRRQKGISAEYIARTVYVSLRTYRKYESGAIAPPIDILIKIADILDVSLDYLLGRDDFIARHSEEKE